MTIYYALDAWGRLTGQSSDPTARCTTTAPPDVPGMWVWNDHIWIDSPGTGALPPVAPPSMQLPRHITPYAYSQRLPIAVRVAVKVLSRTDATVAVLEDDLNRVEYVDLDLPDTYAELYYLMVTFPSIPLTPELIDHILNDPVQDKERPGIVVREIGT